MAKNVTLWGATYPDVPAITVPSGQTTATFTDTSPTTAVDADVAQGKIYFKADGTQSTGTAVPSSPSLQSKTATPTESAQTITPDSGYDGLSQVDVGAIDSEYVGSDVPRNEGIGVLFSDNVILGRKAKLLQANVLAGYYESSDSYSAPEATFNSATSVSINSSGDATITFSPATHGVAYEVETYTVTKTGAVTPRTSSDLSASGATVQVPAGYYAAAASKSVASGSASTPATSITANPSISVSSSGLITATASASQSVTPSVSAGWVSSGTSGTVTVSGSNTSQLSTQGAATITPTTSQQTAVASGKFTTGAVLVDPIPSEYIIPSGTLSISQNGQGINVKAYEFVDVSVSGGGGGTTINAEGEYSVDTQDSVTMASGYNGIISVAKTKALIHSWDFTTGLTDSVGSLTASLMNSATRGSTGVTLGATNQYVSIPFRFKVNHTYEVDIASASKGFSSGHGRLFMIDNSQGFIAQNGSTWRVYSSSHGGWSPSGASSLIGLSGKTVRIVAGHTFPLKDSNGTYNISPISVYIDGSLFLLSYASWRSITTQTYITLGASSASFYNCVISGFRIYEGVDY